MAFTRTRLHLISAIVGVVMALSAEPHLSSQESSVQLEVPVAPVIVNVDGVRQLVYELHATNLRREPVTLRRLRVLADGRGNEVADLEGVSLAGLVGRAGLPRDAGAALTIDPGRRSIVYLWSPLDEARTPRVVQHQLELALDGGATTVVHDPPTRVSTRAVPVIDPPLAGGPWVAVYDPLLVGGHRTTLLALDGRARIPGRFAIDWIRAPGTAGVATPVDAAHGFVADGFGAEVLAVANGRVVDVRDGRPDLPPGVRAPAVAVPLADASGNHVVLDIGNGRFAVYEHLKRDSVVVTRGDRSALAFSCRRRVGTARGRGPALPAAPLRTPGALRLDCRAGRRGTLVGGHGRFERAPARASRRGGGDAVLTGCGLRAAGYGYGDRLTAPNASAPGGARGGRGADAVGGSPRPASGSVPRAP
jgi:murein DD-endopeptidase